MAAVLSGSRVLLRSSPHLCCRRLSTPSMFSRKQPSQPSKVLIFGAGNFGSCLASHLGDSQHEVFMWAREPSLVKHFNTYHRNPMYLKDHHFPPTITAIGPEMPTKEILDEMDVLLFAIPTQVLRWLRVFFCRVSSTEHSLGAI
jgi:hypothetical protein